MTAVIVWFLTVFQGPITHLPTGQFSAKREK